MKFDSRMVIIVAIIAASSVAAASIMYVSDKMSALAFFGWTVMLASPQLALLPSYRRGSCLLLDRMMGRRS